MKLVTPEVRVLASTYMNEDSIAEYLKVTYGQEISEDWYRRVMSGRRMDESTGQAEDLIEFLGRLCYRSFAPGLNTNVTKVRTDQREYFENIVKSEHGSILEHVSITFLFSNVSRVFTHELVRHRAGTAISQESLRYVRLDQDLAMVLPRELHTQGVTMLVNHVEQLQRELVSAHRLDSLPFAEKKRLTSAFRRLAPIGLATAIGWTANLRTLYHVIPLRTAPSAEWEIRLVFDKVAEMVKGMYPNVFAGFRRESDRSWTTEHRKI